MQRQLTRLIKESRVWSGQLAVTTQCTSILYVQATKSPFNMQELLVCGYSNLGYYRALCSLLEGTFQRPFDVKKLLCSKK